jgi:hypothetical protein
MKEKTRSGIVRRLPRTGSPLFAVSCVAAALFSPASPGPAQVIVEDDFEDAEPGCWSMPEETACGPFFVAGGVTSLAVGEVFHSGSRALKLVFSSDEEAGGAVSRFPEEAHLFTRYYDYYAADFDFACGMKTHRISGYNESAGLNHYDMINYTVGIPADGERNYCGVNDLGSMNFSYNGGPVDWGNAGGSPGMVRGQWYCVEHEVLLDDPGAANGEVRVWIVGELVIEGTGLDLRGELEVGMNRVLFGGWYSNGCAGENPCPDPAVPSIRFIDDVAVSTARIGCTLEGPDEDAPEAADEQAPEAADTDALEAVDGTTDADGPPDVVGDPDGNDGGGGDVDAGDGGEGCGCSLAD